MAETTFFVPFVGKASPNADGSRTVHGYVSSGALDLMGHIVDPDWLAGNLPPWMANYGNIREQHDPTRAVGKATELDMTTQPGPFLSTRIIDEQSVKKLDAGIFHGFSVGVIDPVIIKDARAPKGRIVGGELVEVSIVDRPANPDARFVLVKALAGAAEGKKEWREMQSNTTVETAAAPHLTKCMMGECACTCQIGAPDPDCACDCDYCQAARQSIEDMPPSTRDEGSMSDTTVAVPDVTKRDFSDDERDKLADKGFALPDGSFPIETAGDLENAVHAFGRAKDKDAAKAHIVKRAKALGKTDVLPADWDGSTKPDEDGEKAAVPDVVKALNRPKSEPTHVHPFKGVHNHAHDDLRGGMHTHAHMHDDDDMHDHPHLSGKDARMLSPEDREDAMAMQRASGVFMAAKPAVAQKPKPRVTREQMSAALQAAVTKAYETETDPNEGDGGAISTWNDILKDATARIKMLAGQTDQDMDGDVDFPANLAADKPMDERKLDVDAAFGDLSLQSPAHPRLPLDFAAAINDPATKTALLTALAPDLEKRFAAAQEMESQISAVKADLESIKRIAQPVKGTARAIEKGIGLAPDRIVADGMPTDHTAAATKMMAEQVASMNEEQRKAFGVDMVKAIYGDRVPATR